MNICMKLFFISWLFQEQKLKNEIEQLEKDIREQDAYITGRKNEAASLETHIFGYREKYNQYRVKRDELHDERKYDYQLFMLICSKDSSACNLICMLLFRSLWGRESELTAEIEQLKTEVAKAEKSLDHATPGVSA